MASDAASQLILANVDYFEWLHWTWEGAEAIAPITAGHDKVLVVERSNTGEAIGFTKCRSYSNEYQPTMPKSLPRGYHDKETNAYLRLTD
jgi:hypothetical protein